MVVTRYMNGREITQADLRKIKLTDNPVIAQLIDRVVARVNGDVLEHDVSTNNVPA
jgi:hypothetical protein